MLNGFYMSNGSYNFMLLEENATTNPVAWDHAPFAIVAQSDNANPKNADYFFTRNKTGLWNGSLGCAVS